MTKEGMGEIGPGFTSKGNPGHRHSRTELSIDEVQKCFGSIQVLRDFGVSRKASHEMPIHEVDVILPPGADELDFPQLQLWELLAKREPDDSLVQISVTGRRFKQSAHSSVMRL